MMNSYSYTDTFARVNGKAKSNVRNAFILNAVCLLFLLYFKGEFLSRSSVFFLAIIAAYSCYILFYLPFQTNRLLSLQVESVEFLEDGVAIRCFHANFYRSPMIIECPYIDLELVSGAYIKVPAYNKGKAHYSYQMNAKRCESKVYTISSKSWSFPSVLLVVDFFEHSEELVDKLLSISHGDRGNYKDGSS